MSLDVRVEEVAERDLPPVEYRWDADTDILCATLRGSAVAEGLTGSLDIEGRDGAWLTLELRAGRLTAVEVAVWPEVRTVEPLAPPASPTAARVMVPARDGGGAEAAVEVETDVTAVADQAERTIHFRIGAARAIRALRVARELVLEVDARSRLAGLWFLDVPPFPVAR